MNTLEQDIATVKELIYQAKQRGETTDDLEDVLADYEAQLESHNRFVERMQRFDDAMRNLRKN
jgi:uncharacterized protein YozE (UPF0346 family)